MIIYIYFTIYKVFVLVDDAHPIDNEYIYYVRYIYIIDYFDRRVETWQL